MTLSSSYLSEKDKVGNKPNTLIKFYEDETTVHKFIDALEDHTINGELYKSMGFAVSDVTTTKEGGTQQITITIPNVTKFGIQLFAAGALLGKTVEVYKVFRDLTTITPPLWFKGTVTQSPMTEMTITLTVEGKGKILKKPFRMPSHGETCWHDFKDDICRYAGPETSCDRQKATCKSYGNFDNFGGMP